VDDSVLLPGGEDSEAAESKRAGQIILGVDRQVEGFNPVAEGDLDQWEV